MEGSWKHGVSSAHPLLSGLLYPFPNSLAHPTKPSHSEFSDILMLLCIDVYQSFLHRESLFLFSAGESLFTLWDSGPEWYNFLMRPPQLLLGRGKSFPQGPWNTTHYTALSNMHFDDFFTSLYLLANYKLFWSRAPVFFIFVPVAPTTVLFMPGVLPKYLLKKMNT